MSKRLVAKYITILKNKIKESLEILPTIDVKSEDLRLVIVNINNMEMCIREYSEYLRLLNSEDISE